MRHLGRTLSQPWPGLAMATVLLAGCADVFDIERISASSADADVDVIAGADDIVQLAAGGFNSCVLYANGELYCWGRGSGVLADSNVRMPQQVMTNVAHVAVGDAGVCATLRDHTALCWGANELGALGVGFANTTPAGMAFPVLDGAAPASDIAAMAIGNSVGCALRMDGRVTCTGDGGLRGDGSTDAATSHGSAVSALSNVKAIAAGDGHVCGVRTDGDLFCWGENSRNQLGVTGPGTSPQRVVGGPWSAVAAGDEFTCAIGMSDGSVWCWGANDVGQTGRAASSVQATPALVGNQGTMAATSIAAGAVTGYLVRTDTSLAAWGANQHGQIGDGTITTRYSATKLELDEVVEVSAGTGLHVCARTQTDRVFCWGSNETGQLASGTDASANEPVEVLGLP